MQVGKSEDQVLYNKPSATVNPGVLAAGTLSQYNKIPEIRTPSIAQSHKTFSIFTTDFCLCLAVVTQIISLLLQRCFTNVKSYGGGSHFKVNFIKIFELKSNLPTFLFLSNDI